MYRYQEACRVCKSCRQARSSTYKW